MEKIISEKKKIVVDLDVVTISIWDKKGKQVEIANKFIKRIKNKEFYVINPFFLIELVLKWKHQKLSEDIKEFYINYSDKLISDTEFKEKSKEQNINVGSIIKILESHEIKEEDSVLILSASIFNLDYLITFNRKHLRNKKETINKILKENELKTIKIIGPEEI